MYYDIAAFAGTLNENYERNRYLRKCVYFAILITFILQMGVFCAFYSITKYLVSNTASSYKYSIEMYKGTISELETTISTKEEEISNLELEVAQLGVSATEEANYEFSLYKEYWYVLRDAPVGEGVDMAVIAYMDEKAQEKNINPHLAWGMIEHESKYIATAQNSTSTARGLGQFLKSTAKTFYEQERFLGHGEGTYSHDMIDNPYVAVDLITEYLQYLYENYTDTKTMLRFYSGSDNDNYYYAVQNYMQSVGTDITVATYS